MLCRRTSTTERSCKARARAAAAAAALPWESLATDKRSREQPTPEKTAGPAARHDRHDRSASFLRGPILSLENHGINTIDLSKLVALIPEFT